MNPIVIGISGKTGVGKTRLVNALAQNLNAPVFGVDEFDKISNSSTRHIIFDTPLGYLHAYAARHLDVCIHFEIRLPFDDEVKAHADFVIDGILSTEKQLKKIRQYLFDISMD